MSTATDLVIEDQRGQLAAAITLTYCLHTALQREGEEGGGGEHEAVEMAAGWVELTTITGMLMAQLHRIHTALDSVSLIQARALPAHAKSSEPARKLRMDGDDREAS